MLDFFAPLLIGFFGSFHCLGMCGPLVVAYSLHIRSTSPERGSDGTATGLWSKGFAHHLAFHAGRIACYGLLGAAASLFGYLVGFGHFFAGLRSGATIVGGLLMVALGLAILKLFSVPVFSTPLIRPGSLVGRILPRLVASGSITSKLALGFTAGFLPCMLSWAMILNASMASSPLHGFMTMALFGIGTVPALLFTGLSASLLTMRMRLAGERLAACSVIIMGIILLIKGAKYFA
jgi:uncharacterized protein